MVVNAVVLAFITNCVFIILFPSVNLAEIPTKKKQKNSILLL